MWKKIWKFIKYILFFTGIVILGTGISAYIYKDRIINQLIREANKQINTPVRVDKIDLELFEKFPQIAIRFEGVFIEESWPKSTDPLLIAKKAFVTLQPLSLITGNYEINQLHIEDAEVFIRINSEGTNNYSIFSAKGKGENTNDSLIFELQKISLKNVVINYQDENNYQIHKYHTSNQDASIRLEKGIYRINTKGDLTSEYIRIHGRSYAENKSTSVDAVMTYDPDKRLLHFEPSKLLIRTSEYSFRGEINTAEDPHIDLEIEGVNTDIQSLISLLPEDQADSLKDYRSSGEVYFNMSLAGFTTKNVVVDIGFGLKNAELSHPDALKKATGVFLNGKFHAASFSALNKSSLELTGIKGNYGSYPFNGNITLENLDDPVARFDLNGTFEVEELIKWVPETRIKTGKGLIECQIEVKGRLNDLKSRYTSQKVSTSGEFHFIDVNLTFEQDFPLETTINGDFAFSRNDLSIRNTSVKMGTNTWIMNGNFKNILPFLLFKDQFIGIEADINSKYIDVAEFLPPNTAGSENNIEFSISPFLLLDFNCKVEKLKYRKFEARKLSGDLKVKDRRLFAQNIEFNSMGGHLKFAGLVDASGRNINVTSTSHWEDLSIDSVFVVFNNFNQDWLVAENLSGKADADVTTDMTFNPELTFLPDSLVADISISIVDGELNNFEPMMQLEKYVEDENLAHLRFSELRNEIHVENRKIYLPQMEVRSNVSNILVSGSHTFSQEIDYRVVVPLKTLGKKRDDDMFGAVEDDGGGSKLHLKIVGTTDEYEIKYDKEGVKNKMVSDLKKEVSELKNAFKKKETKVEEVILNEDEFFEWEEDTIRQEHPRSPPH